MSMSTSSIIITMDNTEGFKFVTNGKEDEYITMLELALVIELNRQRRPYESDKLLAEKTKNHLLFGLQQVANSQK